jgi:hypothetical protein
MRVKGAATSAHPFNTWRDIAILHARADRDISEARIKATNTKLAATFRRLQ